MSLCHGQLAIANLLKGDIEQAQNDFTECIRIARDLKAVRMQLECLLCMAYISFDKKNWQQAKYFFDEAYNVSFICFSERANICGANEYRWPRSATRVTSPSSASATQALPPATR